MSRARRLLSATKRSTNLLTATQADSPTTLNGWTAGGTSTCVAGSTPGPYGFGTSALFTAGASGARTLTLTSGTFTHGGAKLSAFFKPGTCTSILLALNDATNSILHYASFSVSGGVITLLSSSGGAVAGRVMPYTYDNGWTRLEVEFIPGANGGGATSQSSSLQAYIQISGASSTCEIWGVLLENAAASDYVTTVADGVAVEFPVPAGIAAGVSNSSLLQTTCDLLVTDNEAFVDNTTTPFDLDLTRGKIVFRSPPANGHTIKCARRGSFCTPYLSGISSGVRQDTTIEPTFFPSFNNSRSYAGNELPLFRPQRIKDEMGVFYTEWLNTPSGAMKLQGRSSPNAPWCDLVSITQANLNGAGQYATLVTLMPEMRLVLPTVGNSTVTFTAWILE